MKKYQTQNRSQKNYRSGVPLRKVFALAKKFNFVYREDCAKIICKKYLFTVLREFIFEIIFGSAGIF